MDDGIIVAVVVIVLLFLIIGFSFFFIRKEKRKMEAIFQAFQDQLHHIHGFTSSQSVIGVDGKTALAIDEGRNLIAFLSIDKLNKMTYRIVSANEIISVQVFVGKKSVSGVNNNAVGGAIVGGLMFGVVGAMVGASMASSNAVNEVDTISLYITINDTKFPNHRVNFQTTGAMDPQASEKAHHWLSVLEILFQRSENGQIGPVVDAQVIAPLDKGERKTEIPLLPSAEITQKPGPICELRSASAPHARPIRINQNKFTIGRANTNDLILQDKTVSRQHVIIQYQDGIWAIFDQNSTSGLCINGKKVKKKVLKNGDQIKIGLTLFNFHTNSSE